MNQQFEVKLLLKQNSEMVSKMQIYRRENQALIQKNQDLNLYVQNLSQVFAAIGAAWKTITNNEEAFFALVKKRGDPNSKALISKYVSHFKTFDEIITNLSEKITNSGHSSEATHDAKARLDAFVNNYEMFFKEIVDSFFKFNDQYLQWITQVKNKPELNQSFRTIANKEIENNRKVKEFQLFMNEFRGRFKIYQSENQHKLLDGILFSKNQQINSLNLINQKQTRRINLMTNYSTINAQVLIQADQKDFECFCGGIKLQYFKKQWEKHLREVQNQSNQTATNKMIEQTEFCSSKNKEDYELLQFQKKKLIERIAHLQGKVQKSRIQNKLTEDLVLNSSAHEILYAQTQELVNFVDDLLHKINNHYNYLYEIEKSRQDEILDLKSKFQKNEIFSSKNSIQSPKIKMENNLVEFKSTITDLVKELKKEYVELNGKINIKQQALTKSKQLLASLQDQNRELHKKIEHLQTSKSALLQFRHEKFNQLEVKVTEVLNEHWKPQHGKQKHATISLWKDFIEYVKTRDKKVRDLQNKIVKKDKQITQKDKLLNVLQESLKETEQVYLAAQTQVKKFGDFITNCEKQLHNLAQKNISLRTQFQQEKLLMNYKAKTENQFKLKMEQKIRYYESLQEQIKEVRKFTQQAELNYENWIIEQEKKLMEAELCIEEISKDFEQKKLESEEKDKTVKKLNEQKQKWRSECNKLGAKFHAIEQKSELGVITMELEEYKRKIMCNCSRDQQRSVVLKTCPHAFCKKCIEDMNNSRNRKCPLCGIKFGKSDIHDIILC